MFLDLYRFLISDDSVPILNIYVNLYDLNANLTWSISEIFRLKRFSIGTSKPNSTQFGYIIEYSAVDYGDPNQVITSTNSLSSCYELCYFNSTCVAYVWSDFSSICILKFQKINPIDCANDTICATIPEYKNQLTVVDHLVNTPYCYQISMQDEFGVNSKSSIPNCFECNKLLDSYL